jgi:hypothetical protein
MSEIINPEEIQETAETDENPSKKSVWGRRGVALAIAAAIVLLAAGVAGGGLLFGGSHGPKKPAPKGAVIVSDHISGANTVMSRWNKIVTGPSTETRGAQAAEQIVSVTVHVVPGNITWIARVGKAPTNAVGEQFSGKSTPTDSYLGLTLWGLPPTPESSNLPAGYYGLTPQSGLPDPEMMPSALVHPTIVAEHEVNGHRIWSVVLTQVRANCASVNPSSECAFYLPPSNMFTTLEADGLSQITTPASLPTTSPACTSPKSVPAGQELWCVMLGANNGLVMWPATAGFGSSYRWPGFASSYEGITTSTPPLIATPTN